MLITNIQALNAQDRIALFAAFGFDGSNSVKPVKGAAAAKKPRANLGKSTAVGDYIKKVLAEHNKDSAEFKSFLAKRVAAAEAGEMLYTADQGKVKSGKKAIGDRMTAKEATAGAHIPFAAEWKREHQEDWLAFKSAWEAEHPKGGAVAEASDDATEAEDEANGAANGAAGGAAPAAPVAKAKRGPKKMADMTPDEQAAAKAKRAAKKAEKAASAANSAEVSRSPSPPKVKDD